MGQADLARERAGAAADQPGRRDRVVRRPERPLRRQPAAACSPATLWIRVTSSASARSSGGRIEGRRRASIVLPTPGGPLSSRLWPPAAAIVQRAERARVAADVGEVHRRRASGPAGAPAPAARASASPHPTAAPRPRPGRGAEDLQAVDERRLGRVLARDDEPGQAGPRGALGDRQHAAAPAGPRRRARARRRRRCRSRASAGSRPAAASTPQAMARSKPGPALRRAAGARLTVRRFSGNSKPEFSTAARTRSRASRTARSASPTIVKLGRPARRSTSTVTRRGSSPSIAKVVTRASMAGDARAPARAGSPRRSCRHRPAGARHRAVAERRQGCAESARSARPAARVGA